MENHQLGWRIFFVAQQAAKNSTHRKTATLSIFTKLSYAHMMDSIRSDEKLIADYLGGDGQTLDTLVKRYLKPIYGFAYKYAGTSQEAEDVTQEVFVKVWRNLKRFDQARSFKTWIFSIAKNTALDFLKKKKAISFSEFINENGENALTETFADPSPLPNELLERASVSQTLRKATDRILPKYGKVLALRYQNGLNFREIAEKLAEPLNTVKSRHRRAVIALKKLIAAQ